jgi:hypothetical protein
MEKTMKKIETLVEKYIEQFEQDPLKTSIKILLVLFLFKKAYRLIREA